MNNNQKAKKVLDLLHKAGPPPRTELNYNTPWQLLVATILSAQSTDRQVNRITANLFKKYIGPEDFAALSQAKLEDEIKSIGLFRNKSRYLIAASKAIVEEYGGKVPADIEELCKLPGVGRKTANVVASNAFGIPALGVDTHVFRVSNRIGLANAKNAKQAEEQLTAIIPRDYWSLAHHLLILHGRYVCTARAPKCPDCPVRTECKFFSES